MEDRAPDCATPRAAAIAGIIANAVMAHEMDFMGQAYLPERVEVRFPGPKLGPAIDYDLLEGFRVAGMMISARARASVRTPSHAALSGAEAALALAEHLAEKFPTAEREDLGDIFATVDAIVDTLRAGLALLHAAEGSGPAAV